MCIENNDSLYTSEQAEHTPYCKQAPMCKEPFGNSDCVEQAEQEPVAIIEKESGFETEVYATGYADSLPDGVFKLYAAPTEPMEQKPVAWLSEGGDVSRSKKFFDDMGFKSSPLYAAPVRTKDLTDTELMDCRSSDPAGGSWLESARAVIAADREKNK